MWINLKIWKHYGMAAAAACSTVSYMVSDQLPGTTCGRPWVQSAHQQPWGAPRSFSQACICTYTTHSLQSQTGQLHSAILLSTACWPSGDPAAVVVRAQTHLRRQSDADLIAAAGFPTLHACDLLAVPFWCDCLLPYPRQLQGPLTDCLPPCVLSQDPHLSIMAPPPSPCQCHSPCGAPCSIQSW